MLNLTRLGLICAFMSVGLHASASSNPDNTHRNQLTDSIVHLAADALNRSTDSNYTPVHYHSYGYNRHRRGFRRYGSRYYRGHGYRTRGYYNGRYYRGHRRGYYRRY